MAFAAMGNRRFGDLVGRNRVIRLDGVRPQDARYLKLACLEIYPHFLAAKHNDISVRQLRVVISTGRCNI